MRVYQNVKSSFSNLHFVTFYMNKAVSELKNYSQVSETAIFLEKLKINLHFDSLIFDKLSFDTPSIV